MQNIITFNNIKYIKIGTFEECIKICNGNNPMDETSNEEFYENLIKVNNCIYAPFYNSAKVLVWNGTSWV